MEEVFAGFAANREAASYVGARVQASLHGVADGHVFVLDFFAYCDTLAFVGFGGWVVSAK